MDTPSGRLPDHGFRSHAVPMRLCGSLAIGLLSMAFQATFAFQYEDAPPQEVRPAAGKAALAAAPRSVLDILSETTGKQPPPAPAAAAGPLAAPRPGRRATFDVPRGYEDALPPRQATGGARPAGARPPAAADRSSMLDILAGALGEPVDPALQALEQQYLPRFKPLLKTELSFLRRVCQPDQEQLRQVVSDAQSRLPVVVRRYAAAQNQFRQGRARNTSSAPPQPRNLIQQELTAIVKARLRPEQAARYEEERALQAASRKRAVVLNLVARLDEDLTLSAQQRDKLVELLTANYQDGWEQTLRFLVHNIDLDFNPQIPANVVLPVLNETQKTLWQQVPRSGTVFIDGLEFSSPVTQIEDAQIEALENGF